MTEVEKAESNGFTDVGPRDTEPKLFGCEIGFDDVPVLTIELDVAIEIVPLVPLMEDDTFEYLYEAEENDKGEQLPILLPGTQLTLEFEIRPRAVYCRAFIPAPAFAVESVNNSNIQHCSS